MLCICISMIAFSLNIKRKEHRKLFRPDPTLYVTSHFFKAKWKEIGHFKIISSVHFRILSGENAVILGHELGSANEKVRRMNQQSNLIVWVDPNRYLVRLK